MERFAESSPELENGERQDPPRFTEARRAAAARLDAAEAEAFETALDALMARTPREEAAEQAERDGGETFLGGFSALWRFAAERRPGEAKARIYHPELERDGWSVPHTVLEVVNDDMPFLLDSLSAMAAAHGVEVRSALHPMLEIRRDASGVRIGVCDGAAGEGSDDVVTESWIQLHLERVGDPEICEELRRSAEGTLRDVRACVTDYRPMLARLCASAANLRSTAPKPLRKAASEAAEFLDWLSDGHFTLLACREYGLAAGAAEGGMAATPGEGLGLMRDPDFTVLRDATGAYADWTPEMEAFVAADEPLTILKANRRSTVRRTTHFDIVGVKRFDDQGRVIGQHAFVGLFTASAYTRSPTNIPLLRGKVRRIMERAHFDDDSHDGMALAHILDTHPRDELLQASEDELFAQAMGALQLTTRPRTRLFVRPDRFGRFLSCLVYVSRDRYDTALRKRIADILCEAFQGRVADFTPAFGVDGQIRVHFVVAVRMGRPLDYDAAVIERRIAEAVRDWSDALREALTDRCGADRGAALHLRYGHGFAAGYRDSVGAEEAASDVLKLDALSEQNLITVSFEPPQRADASGLRFKLYRFGEPAPLSDVIPILENLGLRILEERPHEVVRRPVESDAPGARLFIHDFATLATEGAPVALETRRAVLEEGFLEIWRGRVEDDRLNRLMLGAGLAAREIALLRGYSRFLRQARVPYSVDYMEDALIGNPRVARALRDLFRVQFDPEPAQTPEAREAAATRICDEIEALLEEVSRLDFDRILRRLRNAIRSTLRTNYFQPAADGAPKDYFSFKLDCAALEELPDPRPWREIFVYSDRGSKACICATARLPGAGCAGRTARRISAPRCWAW